MKFHACVTKDNTKLCQVESEAQYAFAAFGCKQTFLRRVQFLILALQLFYFTLLLRKGITCCVL